MARYQDTDWNLPDELTKWEQVNTAVLMDIRDELKRLNRLLECRNFQAIPGYLRGIKMNTTKKKRQKAPKV